MCVCVWTCVEISVHLFLLGGGGVPACHPGFMWKRLRHTFRGSRIFKRSEGQLGSRNICTGARSPLASCKISAWRGGASRGVFFPPAFL